jgi:RNA polymerase sigma-70 factor (ECF subfamily)
MALGMVSTDSRERDATARFEQLVSTYEAPLARYLFGMVGDVETARDLTQETLLSAFRALDHTHVVNLSAWLYRIATNEALAHLRRRRLMNWVSFSFLLGATSEPRQAGHGDQVTLRWSIEAALDQLEPKDRAALLLNAAGFASQEIAEQLNCSAGAARVRLCRARQAFRRAYRPDTATEDD